MAAGEASYNVRNGRAADLNQIRDGLLGSPLGDQFPNPDYFWRRKLTVGVTLPPSVEIVNHYFILRVGAVGPMQVVNVQVQGLPSLGSTDRWRASAGGGKNVCATSRLRLSWRVPVSLMNDTLG
jgi:hypothetical protein